MSLCQSTMTSDTSAHCPRHVMAAVYTMQRLTLSHTASVSFIQSSAETTPGAHTSLSYICHVLVTKSCDNRSVIIVCDARITHVDSLYSNMTKQTKQHVTNDVILHCQL